MAKKSAIVQYKGEPKKQLRCKKYYKMARPDGWDFYTGKTINCRDNIGREVNIADMNNYKLCSASVIHASRNPNDCFLGVKSLPVSCFLAEGKPVVETAQKSGFVKLKILKEIPQNELDALLGWKYLEVCNPINPLTISNKPTKKDWELLKSWATVRVSVWATTRVSSRASVGDLVRASVKASARDLVRDLVWDSARNLFWDSVRASVWASVWASVGASVGDSVKDSVRASAKATVWDLVWDSVWDSVWAYISSLFPNIKKWKYCNFKYEGNPFQPAVDLWKRGFIPLKIEDNWVLWNKEKGIIKEESASD